MRLDIAAPDREILPSMDDGMIITAIIVGVVIVVIAAVLIIKKIKNNRQSNASVEIKAETTVEEN